MNKFADARFLQANEAPRPNGRGIFSPLLRRERNPSEAPLGGAKGDKFLIKNILSQKGLVDLFALLGIAIMLITLPAANKLLSERQEIRKQAQDSVCPIGCCGGECGTCPSGQSCDIQNGACSSGLSCNPKGYGTHLACRDNQCVWEPGDGAAECSTNEECEQKQKVICTANECCGTDVKCNSAGTACNVADSSCGAKQVCWPENCCAEGFKCRPDGSTCDVASTLCKSTPPPPTPTITPKATPTITPTITPTPSLSLACSGNAPNGGVFRCDNPSDTHFGFYKCYQRPDKPKPACYLEYEKIPERDTSCKGQICVRYKGWFCDDSNKPKGACDCCDAFATSTPTPIPTSTPTVTPTPLPNECKGSGLHCVPQSEINLGIYTCYNKASNSNKPACYLDERILSDKDCGDKFCTSYKGWWCLDNEGKLAGNLPDECKSCCSNYVKTEPTPTPIVSCNGKSYIFVSGTCWACGNNKPDTNFDNQRFLCDAESAGICQGKKIGDPVPYSGRCFTCFDNGYGIHVNVDVSIEACNVSSDSWISSSTDGNSTLTGIIQGSIIANATITLVDPSGKKYTAKTDNSGNFTIDVPTDKTYTVTITAPGYKSFTFVWDPSDGRDYFSEIKLEKIKSDKEGSFALEEKVEKQHLVHGWNLISLPVKPTKPLTASSLASEINLQDGKIASVSRWKDSSWETHITNLDKNDFPIEVGIAYFVENENEVDFTIQGEEITQPRPLELIPGWNAVSFPKTVNCQTNACYAQLMLNLIDVTKLNSAKSISYFSSSLWEALTKEKDKYFGNNFLINPGVGYFLKVSQPVRFLP